MVEATSSTMMSQLKQLVFMAVNCLLRRNKTKEKLLAERNNGKKRTFLEICGTSRFFWPNISRQSAELALRDKPDGTFLVWCNASGTDETIELFYKREGNIMNMKIDYCEDGFSLDHSNTQLPKGNSLDGLILTLLSKCKDHSLVVADETKMQFSLMKLKFPITRNVTLMDHCRKAILSSHPNIGFDSLDLPRELTTFLMGENTSC